MKKISQLMGLTALAAAAALPAWAQEAAEVVTEAAEAVVTPVMDKGDVAGC